MVYHIFTESLCSSHLQGLSLYFKFQIKAVVHIRRAAARDCLETALAPLLDKGATIASSFKAITGGGAPYMNYGFNLKLKV